MTLGFVVRLVSIIVNGTEVDTENAVETLRDLEVKSAGMKYILIGFEVDAKSIVKAASDIETLIYLQKCKVCTNI